MKSLFPLVLVLGCMLPAVGGTKTWDGRHDTRIIEVTMVYFVPADRRPLPDWQERVEYFRRRLELFHTREFQGQSILKASISREPLISASTTEELRRGDGNAIFYRTLEETEKRLGFAQKKGESFPILLVLSDINWRPLDDFHRLKPEAGSLVFEGNYSQGQHFPGAASGGARATYLADRGVGWGLVSADGWRVPYRGSDCVIYHEGCGHTVGLPHPEPGNNSVMSMGQYVGWLGESWLDEDQKQRLGWQKGEVEPDREIELFTRFRGLPEPRVPSPGEAVTLALEWPEGEKVKSLSVRFQTSVDGPWIGAPQDWEGDALATARLGVFDRETPVSYRLDAELESGEKAELWGYFQVRADKERNPLPYSLSPDLVMASATEEAISDIKNPPDQEVDLLGLANPETCWRVGDWAIEEGQLVSPKRYGARIELPYSPPEEYRLVVVVEPLDEPNGLILGQRVSGRRFVALVNYVPREQGRSALEDVDGKNVGNETTLAGDLLLKNRLSQVVVNVRKAGVTVSVDGRRIVGWRGSPDRLSLSDYWTTPDDSALFLGAYDCRYRFHRITLEAISGEGRVLERPAGNGPGQ